MTISESFVEELDRAIRLIRSTPLRWPKFRSGTRRFLMRRFPFSVVYRLEPDAVIVIAVAHARRRPGYWRKRRTPLGRQ